jgi:hypothetical protein
MAESSKSWYEDVSDWIESAYDTIGLKNFSESLSSVFSEGVAISSASNSSGQDWKWGELSESWSSIGAMFVDGGSALTSGGAAGAAGGLGKWVGATGSAILNAVNSGIGVAAGGVSWAASNAATIGATVGDALAEFESLYDSLAGGTVTWADSIGSTIDTVCDVAGSSGGSVILSAITKGVSIFSDGALRQYTNGVDSTSFGDIMDSSWKGSSGLLRSILNPGTGSSGYTLHYVEGTPLNSGDSSDNLYGNMLLGAPPAFTNIADPKNRAISQSFLKDASFLTMVPGFPKYNGSIYLANTNDDQLHQTTTPDQMMTYLINNGLSGSFAKADRRYYTFKTDYEEYYRYLETMLNAIWVKMGLSDEGGGRYGLYTFFDHTDGGSETLKSQYRHPLGFMVNPAGAVTESLNSSVTSFGSSLMSQVNDQSETYQQINYLTGMGTGGNVRNAARKAALAAGVASNMKSLVSDSFSNTISGIKKGQKWYSKLIYGALGAVTDVNNFLTQQDTGAIMQSYATTNGMKVVYPELWSDSGFSRSVSINFEFISPYGDPLSVFHYVMVPFLSLLCYAMPRQAADNGYVSPFFVRADIPGFFTSDLALISDFSWTRGGNQGIWTKDGLPRAIAGSFTLADLYPYLAMTKRLSFLSANPNYTSFLNSLSGFHAIDATNDGDGLNEYWLSMLDRMSSDEDAGGKWNKYGSNEMAGHRMYSGQRRKTRFGNKSSNSGAVWLRKVN